MKLPMENDALDDGWDDFDVDDSGVVEENPVIAGGWDDEDDLAFLDDDEVDTNDDDDDDAFQNNEKKGHNQVTSNKASSYAALSPIKVENKDVNGWEEDDDLNFDDEDGEDGDQQLFDSRTTQPAPSAGMPSQMCGQLENYVNIMSHLNASVNAVLETEYNTPQKAIEVLEYFTERPGLVEYTIEKELPRMEYIVIEESGMPLQGKEQIAAWMVQAGSAGSLLPRCANQSLLADLLQAMTGPDMLIRPQFLATAIATSCSFVLDAIQESIMVKSNMELTIPTEEGRWKIADLGVFCQLNVSSSPPSILYRLDVVKPTTRNDAWKAQMTSAARLIESMELPEESFMNVSYQQQSEDGMHYRDAFLQQSQTILQNSAVGLRSALREIDAVAGFSHKLSKFQGFLPEDVMEAADRVQERSSVQAANPEHRPTSIIGGFLSSGLNRLAQSVSLPEEDPEYYKDWQEQQQRQMPRRHDGARSQVQPKLYNRPEAEETHNSQIEPGLVTGRHPRAPLVGAAHRNTHNKSTIPIQEAHRTQYTEASQVKEEQRERSWKTPQTQASEMKPSGKDDGWEMNDDDLFSPDELATMETKSPWGDKAPPHEQNRLSKDEPGKIDGNDMEGDWVYDPETDIIPTRKRWVNPRPGMRTLEYFMAGQ